MSVVRAAGGGRLVVGQFGDSDLVVLGFCSDKELDKIKHYYFSRALFLRLNRHFLGFCPILN